MKMMNIRQIQPYELAAFAAIGSHADEAVQVQSYLDKMIGLGSIRLEWCYVMEEDGHLCGRIAFWTMPKVGKPLAMVLLELPWNQENYISLGATLLEKTLPIMKTYGAVNIEHVLDTPPVNPQFQRHAEKRMNVLSHLGFHEIRETKRFEWQVDSISTTASTRSLSFLALPEVGEDAFIEAIMKVSALTLDQRINGERSEVGARQHAAELFEELKEMEYEPDWWQLAYDADGQLVGFVMPAKAPAFSTIAYIGVIPEQRGKGYIDPLLNQGTSLLLAAGETLIRADTDVSNFPMAQAFLRSGYTQFSTRKEYSLKLEDD
jgi:ribosomal protein S18 acetylase RimI-like enzyme